MRRREWRRNRRPGHGAGARKGLRRWAFGALLTLSLGVPALVSAQGAVERPNAEEARKAIGLIRSPYCPGFMLEVCPSPQAAALRDSIYDLTAQGLSAEEVVEWMVANHGEEWRALPKRSGAGLLAWVVPPLALLVGVGALVGWLRSNRATRPGVEEAPPPEADEMSEADRAKVAAALREWEASGPEEP